jgi:hypothetical protein
VNRHTEDTARMGIVITKPVPPTPEQRRDAGAVAGGAAQAAGGGDAAGAEQPGGERRETHCRQVMFDGERFKGDFRDDDGT